MYLKKRTASAYDAIFELDKICDNLFYASTQQVISDLEDHKDKFSNEITQIKLIEKELNDLGEAVSNIIDNIKRKINEDATIASFDNKSL